jgi:AraC-like DNA-binding protein
MVVKAECERVGLYCSSVRLGEIEVVGDICKLQYDQLKNALEKFGLELMEDKKSVLMEKVKNIITELIHYSDDPLKINFSNYLSEKLNYNYTFISNQFSETQGISIRNHIILHKIERVKELLVYDELNITEIAHKLNYSSVAHLSNQFKKVTGFTPSHFKEFKHQGRIELENI